MNKNKHEGNNAKRTIGTATFDYNVGLMFDDRDKNNFLDTTISTANTAATTTTSTMTVGGFKRRRIVKDELLMMALPHHVQVLPSNTIVIYDKIVPQDGDEGDYGGDTGGGDSDSGGDNDESSYSILEMKSPLVTKGDSRFDLSVEVVGIYTGSRGSGGSSSKGGGTSVDDRDTISIPSMAMVVVKSTTQPPTNANRSTTNNSSVDIIRQRLFQDSIDKIIHSLDVGLDAFAGCDVSLLSTISSLSSSSQSTSSNVNVSSTVLVTRHKSR